MCENITKKLENLKQVNVPWQSNLFYKVSDWLNSCAIDVSYWEGEENWASLSINGSGIGFLWRKYPLIFAKANSSFIKKMKSNFPSLEIIEVTFLESPELYLERKTALFFFQKNWENCFSAEDIWFETNSR